MGNTEFPFIMAALVNPPHEIYKILVAQYHQPLGVPLARFLKHQHPNLLVRRCIAHNAPEPVPQPLGEALPQLDLDMEQGGHHVSPVSVYPRDGNALTEQVFRHAAF